MKPVAPFLRTPYNYDTNKAGDESGLECKDKTLTQQQFADESDINKLMERYVTGGEIPQLTIPPLTGDFTNLPDMQSALDMVVKARESFMQLPAKARARFNNNAVEFVAFCSDESNRDEMRQLGLWSPEAAESFRIQQQTAADLAAANAQDAAELKALKKGKGDTPKGVT